MTLFKFVFDPERVCVEPASLSVVLGKDWANRKAASPLDSGEDGKFPWKPKVNRGQTVGFFWANILRETKVMMMCKGEWGCPLTQRQVDENRDSHRWIIVSPLPESLCLWQHNKYQLSKMLTAVLEIASEIEEGEISVETRDSCPCLGWEMPTLQKCGWL